MTKQTLIKESAYPLLIFYEYFLNIHCILLIYCKINVFRMHLVSKNTFEEIVILVHRTSHIYFRKTFFLICCFTLIIFLIQGYTRKAFSKINLHEI